MMQLGAADGLAATPFEPPDPARLAVAIAALLRFTPSATALALDGATTSANLIQALCEPSLSCQAA
jgi:predicted glycosyltransferase